MFISINAERNSVRFSPVSSTQVLLFYPHEASHIQVVHEKGSSNAVVRNNTFFQDRAASD